MDETVYALCGVTSVVCAVLLLRGFRSSGQRLLFWSALCFVGLAIDNVTLFVDVVMLPHIDLFLWRTMPALAGILVLLYGMIWEAR